MSEEIAIKESPLLKELEMVEDAGSLHLKGYSYANISELLHISPYKAKGYVQEYLLIMQKQSEDDPYFLERVQANTIKFLNELDLISKEAWETVSVATENEMVGARIQALKLALEVTTKKAQLHQLMSGGKTADGDYIARMNKAESVNQLLSDILRDVVSDCDRCREAARVHLAEAFSLMGNVEDAEVVHEEEA